MSNSWTSVIHSNNTLTYELLTISLFNFCLTESDYSVETKVVQADFSDGRNIYQRIANELSSVDIGILGKIVTILVMPDIFGVYLIVISFCL